MRALTRRHVALTRPGVAPAVDRDSMTPPPSRRRRATGPRAELFVTGTRPAALAPSMRRPVPAMEEALMYPTDRPNVAGTCADDGPPPASLIILGVGSAVSLVLAVMVATDVGADAAFVAGLGGYVYFLRTRCCAIRSGAKRAGRRRRAAGGTTSPSASNSPRPSPPCASTTTTSRAHQTPSPSPASTGGALADSRPKRRASEPNSRTC